MNQAMAMGFVIACKSNNSLVRWFVGSFVHPDHRWLCVQVRPRLEKEIEPRLFEALRDARQAAGKRGLNPILTQSLSQLLVTLMDR